MSKMVLENEKALDKRTLSLVKKFTGCSGESAKSLLCELKALWDTTEPSGDILLYSDSGAKSLATSSLDSHKTDC